MSPSEICAELTVLIDRIDKECGHIENIDPLIVRIASTLALLECSYLEAGAVNDFDTKARRIFFEITGRDIRIT